MTLVVAPVVIRELNEKKDTPGPTKTRDRAGSALRWLNQFIGKPSPHVRKNVDILLQPHDPQIDFSGFRLSQAINDDWLLAAALEFIHKKHMQNVVLVTDDTRLRIKAAAQGITAEPLPEDLKLPEEVEPAEKRVRELEHELLRLRNASPDVCLLFNNNESHVNVQLPRAPEFSQESVREKVEEVRRQFPKLNKPSGYSGADLARGVVLVPEEIDEYNKQADDYYRSYENYLKGMSHFEGLKCNTARLQIMLLNRGGAPAQDIDIFVHFPDGFDVYNEPGLDSAIVMPVEPEKPKTRLETIATTFAATLGRWSPVIGKPSKTMWSNVGDWSIKRESSFDVRTHVKELKHKLQTALEPLFVVFPSREAAKSFGIDYKLLAANVPDKIEGQLHVIVETL